MTKFDVESIGAIIVLILCVALAFVAFLHLFGSSTAETQRANEAMALCKSKGYDTVALMVNDGTSVVSCGYLLKSTP